MEKIPCIGAQNVSNDSARFFVFLLSAVVLMGNLAAIIDFFLHPEKPYFSQDHLIIGGVASLLCGIQSCLTLLYASKARPAFLKGDPLESILPICANCKKVRIFDSTKSTSESWQPLDFYIAERTATKFSHGCCPDCVKTLYPELTLEGKHPRQTPLELVYT